MTTTNTSTTPSPTTDFNPTSFLHILPHILLPILLILAYFPPPFRGRAPLFLALLAIVQWQCTTSPWPPNAGDTRALRYGLNSSWIFALPVVERMVMHTPEKDFFRVVDDDDSDKVKKGKSQLVREWSCGKLWRAVRLVCTPRAVGWNFGSRMINDQRKEMRRRRLAKERQLQRGQFAVRSLVRAFACYLAWDLVMLAEKKVVTIPDAESWRWGWSREALGEMAKVELIMLATVYLGMNLWFETAAAIGSGLGLNQPEEWPPLFGSLFDCYTTANVWGKFWHQYLRQPCLGFSRRLVELLHVPRRSTLAYLIHLTNAFLISTFFHVLSVGTVAGGYYPLRSLISDMSIFFMLQPVGAMIEGAVMALFARYVWAPKGKGGPEGTTRRSRIAEVVIPSVCQGVGYVWVVCWFFVTSFWFVKGYAGVGTQNWKLPYSIMERVLVCGN
ncbi:hypothetical protein B0H66DRAFT_608514 [Apodospora peruviana]|uniref:Wax synthase domain-containing protein n=1 Tax=Apodospora peruviana TaxID=516989 RepID=A0AAE0HUI9_9PEZI|nr:hypothetical protein B0H66DRAFT_608514 [Apodospora peruviana]